MYKDKRGKYLSVGQVVVTDTGDFYTVVSFDTSREYFVELSNGCVKCYVKPEALLCVNSVSDFYENW